MKKVLLGTTALLAAGTMAATAVAQEIRPRGALDISYGGRGEFSVHYTDSDISTRPDREWFFRQELRMFITATGVGDATGVTYGVRLDGRIEDGGTGNDNRGYRFDDTYLFFTGGFGEVRLGASDPVNEVLGIVGSTFTGKGTGGIDGIFFGGPGVAIRTQQSPNLAGKLTTRSTAATSSRPPVPVAAAGPTS
jgi:hypothetical protein